MVMAPDLFFAAQSRAAPSLSERMEILLTDKPNNPKID